MTAPDTDRSDEAAYLADHLARVRAAWPEDVPREPWWPHGEIALSEYLRAWARTQPDKPAVIFYGRTLSYRELDELSDRFAALLAAQGVVAGDRVAVFLPNCPQFLIAFYGILKCAAVHAPVSPLSRPFELAYQLGDTGAETILTLDTLMPLVREVKAGSTLRTLLVTSFADMLPQTPTLPLPEALKAAAIPCPDAVDLMPALATAGAPPDVQPGLGAVAALNYTGGTTGMPKGCVHTQEDMLYTASTNLGIASPVADDTVFLSFFPAFWIAGENACLIYPIFGGATLVLLARWDPIAFLAAIARYRVTNVGLPVDGTVELMDHPRFAEFDLASLRQVRVVSFVKKLNVAYRARWREMTGTTLAESAWGMTETHTSDTFTSGMQGDDFDLRSQPVFVGLPMPGTQFKICDFDTGALVPFGEEGEICVRTPSLFKGYWNKPEASEEAIRGGFLHTGDIGILDEAGYLHFLGRRKEMLKVKGMSVFPAEIEAVLGQHPQIAGSGVVGRHDAERGQVPVAFVSLNAGADLTPDTLSAWLAERVATYKLPEIRLLDQLPMTATGKVKKGELSKFLA